MKKRIETPAKPCRVMDKNNNIYHPTQAPAGMSKCGVMLELKARKADYVFPSKARACHAIDHTIRYLKANNLPFDPSVYILVEA